MRNFVSVIVLVLITILYGLPLDRAAAVGMNIGELPGVTLQAEVTAGSDGCLPSPERCVGESSDDRFASTHCLGDCPAWQARVELPAPTRAALLKLLPDPMPRRLVIASLLRPPIAA